MYLRTPKRYQPRTKPQRHVVSGRFVRLLLFTVMVVAVGTLIYQRQEELGPPVQNFVNTLVDDARGQMATMQAPTPMPTENPASRIQRAETAWQRGAIEEALDEYEQLLSAVPNDFGVHYRYTLGLIMAGRTEEAIAAAEQTVTANPFAADAWAIRALALDRGERYGEAIASALQALAIDDENARALAYMAEAYFDSDRVDLAQETIARALDMDPNSAEAHHINALINWQGTFDFDTAQDSFEVASAEAPNLPYIKVDRAWFEWGTGNFEVAQELLNDVLELNPTNLDALYAMGYLYNQAYGDPTQSRDYLERCIGASPMNVACLWYLGNVQAALGDSQGALTSFRTLMQTSTQNPRHFLDSGRAFMNAGDCSSAISVLRDGLAYQREQDDANIDRIALFEEYLTECGA
jgi:tetratricopeptide (TPR) repeat protein